MKITHDQSFLGWDRWVRAVVLMVALLCCADVCADKTARGDKSKNRDSKADYPLELRLDTQADNFWQNTGQNAEGNPFYFSGPHYDGNKFEWRKKVNAALTNPKFYIRKGNATVKKYSIAVAGTTWKDVAFTGDLQPLNPDPNQPRYLDPGQNGKETYTAVVGAWISGKWVRSNGIDFDVKRRTIFWYDATDTAADKGMPNALGVADELGTISTDAASDCDILVCAGTWDTAWGYQTVQGEFRSYDHGGPLYIDVNNNNLMDNADRATYAQINIGEANAKYTGFNQAGLGIASGAWPPGTHIPQSLFLPDVTIRLNHCNTASRSCGYIDTPQNPWPSVPNMAIPQNDANGHPRIIDTMDAVGAGIGSGVVKGWDGKYVWEFKFPMEVGLLSTTPGNPTEAQTELVGNYVASLAPTTYVAFKAGQGGTDQGWLAYFVAQGTAWAQNQFNDPNMSVTVAGGHVMNENPDGATEHENIYQ